MQATDHPSFRRPAPLPLLAVAITALLVTAVRAAVWTPVASMNLPRGAHGAAGLNGKLYALGGDNGAFTYTITAEVYDPAANTWTNIATMPNNKGEHGVAAVAGKVYAIGGWSGGPTNSVFAYDPSGNSWSTVASLNLARRGVAAAVSGGKIYAIGGFNGAVRTEVEAYDPGTNSWSFVASLNVPRLSPAAAATADGKIYVMGGHPDTGAAQTAEVYNPATNSWSLIASMNAPRHAPGAARGVDDRIYVIGGAQGAPGAASSVEVYDPNANTWSFVASMNTPRQFLAAATVGEKIYALGGSNGSVSHLSSVEVLDAPDVTAPSCRMNPVVPNSVSTQVYLPITLSDSGRGIASVKLTSRSSNCRLECYRDAAHTQPLGVVNSVGGTLTLNPTAPMVYVKALKNSGSRSTVELLISDGVLSTLCDPVIAELKIPQGGRRLTRVFKGIPDFEHYITVQNAEPGLASVVIHVNGRLAGRGGLSGGETRTFNVAHLMRSGEGNRVQVTAAGGAGAKALLVIADVPQDGSEHPHAPMNQEFAR